MTKKKKKRISTKDANAKTIRLVDVDPERGKVQMMKEPDFRNSVENNNLICFNTPTFNATVLAGESPGNDVWWPANSSLGGQPIPGKGRDRGKGKEKAPAVTEPSVSYTHLRTRESFCVPKSIFCRSVPENIVYMNFAALGELYVVDDMNKAEQSSTTPRLWEVDQEWEEFLTQEPIFMEESRLIHKMLSSQLVRKKDGEEQLADDEHVEKDLEEELPGHVGGTSAAGRKDEQHVYEQHSGVQGLASTFVEEEEELKEQSQAEYSGGSQHAVEQGLASTSVEEELKKQPQLEYSGGPKHAAGAVQEALTLLKNKGDEATTKELCAAMYSIATGIFRSIEETNTRLDVIDSRLNGIDF